MRRIAPAVLLASVLLGRPSVSPGQDAEPEGKPILPGYWFYSTSTILPGTSDGRQCVRPDQIDEFISGPHNRHYHCTYPSKSLSGGRASFDGECVGKHNDRYLIRVSGTYSATRFTLKGHISGKIFGLPLTAPIAIDAKWIGPDCPPTVK